jgi:hypothetical protein
VSDGTEARYHRAVSLAQRIAEKWSATGIARDQETETAAAAAALDALAQLRGIALPATFRELWAISDGTATMDDDELTFWPLDNIASDPALGPWQGLLVFADCGLGSRLFCIRFDGACAGGVVDTVGEPLARSFDEFLERYLADAASLIRGGAGREVG